MLFHVRMDVHIPHDLPTETVARLKTEERALSQKLQHSGKWRHIWRIVGQYSNISIFDVENGTELHELLMSLPLFPYMQIEVMSLCRHPSSIHDNDY